MGKLERGIKAGILAMIITQFIGSIISIILFSATIPHFENPSLITFMVVSMLIGGVIIGAIIGAILGLIYAALYTVLPSDSPIIKGMILGLAYYLISTFMWLLFVSMFVMPPSVGMIDMMLATITNPIGISTLILNIFIFGFLIGKFWGTEPLEEEIAFTEMSPGMA